MSVLAVGLSHRTAPVSLLEQVVGCADVPKLALDVLSSPHVAETVVVSTCNRVEIYADVTKFHGGVVEISELLAQHAGLPIDALTPHLYVHYEDRAVGHLFGVACGLDSMVVGESQVLGQVRLALRRAQEQGVAGRALNELFQQALRVGKRAHAETDVDRAGASVLGVAIEIGERATRPVRGLRALVVGAGSMSGLATAMLRRAGVSDLLVANRTLAHAERLAAQAGGRAVPLDRIDDALAAADVVVSCTGATGLVISLPQVAGAQRRRAGSPQLLLDLALPRDVDPAAAALRGVTVVDLETVAAELAGDERAADVEAVRRIVAEETAAYLGWERAAQVAPTVVALRSMAADVVDAELTRLAGRLPDLDERSRDEVALTVRRVVDKVLHAPTVRVKELAGEPGGDSYATVLRELFDLDRAAVEAVSRPAPDVLPEAGSPEAGSPEAGSPGAGGAA